MKKKRYLKPIITTNKIKTANFFRPVFDENLLVYAACCSEVPPCEAWQLCAN